MADLESILHAKYGVAIDRVEGVGDDEIDNLPDLCKILTVILLGVLFYTQIIRI